MNYFIVRNGQQAGPFPVNQLLAEGLTPTTQVWCEGMANWQPATEVPEVAALLSNFQAEQTAYQQPAYAQPAPPAPPAPPAQGYQQPAQPAQGYQQPAQPAQGYQQPAQPQSYGYNTQTRPPMPETHMVKSILVTLFCCQIFGIIGIVYASSVSSSYNAGNYAEAKAKSESANKWCNWGIIGGLVYLVLVVIYMIIAFASGAYY